MRKWVSLALAAIFMTLMFAGCANPVTVQDTAADAEKLSASPDTDPIGVPPENGEPKKKILIAYFSRSGNTKQIADMLYEQLGGDMFRIETTMPYSEDYNTALNKAQEEQRSNARPALTAHVDNMDDYDIVFVGHPIWWGDTPMAVLTFLEGYDFSGKTVIPFCTYGSSGSGRSISSIKSAADGATVLDGFSVRGSDASEAKDRITEWLNGLGIFETSVQSPPTTEASTQTEGDTVKRINIQVGSKSFTIILYNNASTQALLAQMPLTLNMSELNGNEKYYYLSDNLPVDSQRVGSINAGDLMLFGSNWLVLFYEGFSTSYSYTPFGYMEDASGLAQALGRGSVQVTFSY